MKVFYKKGHHVIIHFPAKELKQALGVLKALAAYFRAPFILKAAGDLENDLQPKLGYDNRFHICINCFCEIDTQGGNCLFVDDSWLHKECPHLKEKRPI